MGGSLNQLENKGVPSQLVLLRTDGLSCSIFVFATLNALLAHESPTCSLKVLSRYCLLPPRLSLQRWASSLSRMVWSSRFEYEIRV